MTDVSDLIKKIRAHGAQRVALQFPEGLKRHASVIAGELRNEGLSIIVSGDPCYGACDLDLDTLGMADLLVHFGHAPVDVRESVIYEPYFLDFDVNVLAHALPLLKGRKVGLVTTIQHAHLIPVMEEYLTGKGLSCAVSEGGGRTPMRGQVLGCSWNAAKNVPSDEILYVGTGLFHPIGVQVATRKHVVALDPYTGIAQEVEGSGFLRKRFAVIERAMDAKNYGILLSLKSGQRRQALAENLVTLSKKAVIVTMHEVCGDELLNLGFDAYVNTACPRIAYEDQERFPVPVLTPSEFEILCGVRHWDDYLIDELPPV